VFIRVLPSATLSRTWRISRDALLRSDDAPRRSRTSSDAPSPVASRPQAAAVNTTTEAKAKIKVAINGFGRIGASPPALRN
jgi:hypothetical protein